MLASLRAWMIQKIVPWMVWPFARGATNGTAHILLYIPVVAHLSADEAKTMMQGVGSRFDFHMHKTLCDLRYVNDRSCSADIFISIIVRARYLTSS